MIGPSTTPLQTNHLYSSLLSFRWRRRKLSDDQWLCLAESFSNCDKSTTKTTKLSTGPCSILFSNVSIAVLPGLVCYQTPGYHGIPKSQLIRSPWPGLRIHPGLSRACHTNTSRRLGHPVTLTALRIPARWWRLWDYSSLYTVNQKSCIISCGILVWLTALCPLRLLSFQQQSPFLSGIEPSQ